MKHFKSLTAILVMLTLVLASCGEQTPVVNDASSSTNESTDSGLETEALTGLTPTPTVTIIPTGYQNIDLRVDTDLVQFFKVTYAGTKLVSVNITSDKDGSLFNGVWNTTVNPLGSNNSVVRTFSTPGIRVLTVTAVSAGRSNTGKIYLNVINTAPVIKLHYYGNPHVGEAFWVMAQIFDKNEPNGVAMCANTTWTIDAEAGVLDTALAEYSGTAELGVGCGVKLRFKTVFGHQLRVTTHDSEGIVAVNAVNLTVLPAFVGPRLNPRFFKAEERSGNVAGSRGSGKTLDLTSNGTTFTFDGMKPISTARYQAVLKLFVTNDQGIESVLYTEAGLKGIFYPDFFSALWFYYGSGTAPITRDCRIEIELTNLDGNVGTIPVWVGKCKYNTQKLN
jgi:hypothetical protein